MPPLERSAAAEASATAFVHASDPDRGPSPTPFAVCPTDHIKWARTIARGVRHRYGFLRDSQEERELEATANLVVCEYAKRFDPVSAFWGGTERAVEAACKRWRPKCVPSPQWADVRFAGVDFGGRAMELARHVAEVRALVPDDEYRALVRFALKVAHERVRAFDPIGAFRGWAAVEVRSRCQREAMRLRNAGTFRTVAKANFHWQAVGLPGAADECAEIDEPEPPRQLQAHDDEYDENGEWWLLFLQWCVAMCRSKRRRRAEVPVGGISGPT